MHLFFLMYAQMAFVTSVRGKVFFPPQMAAIAGLRVFGAKMPLPVDFKHNSRSCTTELSIWIHPFGQ